MLNMEKDISGQLILDMTLSLAYLCSWDEKAIAGESTYRAWKGYDFDILDKLKEEGLIDFSYKAKSLYITDEGIKKAKEIVARFRSGT
jgi:hypothetical protein